MTTATSHEPIKEVVTHIDELGTERVSVEDILETFGHRSFGPIFLMLGLIPATPLGGIPGLPSLIGVLCILFGVQILLGETDIWVPGSIGRRSIKTRAVMRTYQKYKKIWRWFDGLATERLRFATGRKAVKLSGVIIMCLGVMLFPLELVPFLDFIPGVAIALMGFGLYARDGVFILAGYALCIASLYVVFFLSPVSRLIGL